MEGKVNETNNDKIEIDPMHLNRGLDPKVLAVLAYFLWLVGGILFFATSKDSYVRFHAMQSILFNAVVAALYIFLTIFGFIFWFLTGVIAILLWAAIFAIWIVLMVKAYQGERFKLPIIGKLAEKLVQ